MAVLAPQNVEVTGLEATYATCAGGGDSFVNTGRQMIHIKNGHSSPQTVTVDDPKSQSPAGAEAFDPDVAVEVTNAEDRFIGPFDPARFGASVALTYDGVVALTIAILQF